jgi:hypothetical protein
MQSCQQLLQQLSAGHSFWLESMTQSTASGSIGAMSCATDFQLHMRITGFMFIAKGGGVISGLLHRYASLMLI